MQKGRGDVAANAAVLAMGILWQPPYSQLPLGWEGDPLHLIVISFYNEFLNVRLKKIYYTMESDVVGMDRSQAAS